VSSPRQSWSALERRLGYSFRDPAVLMRALTHRSFANENRAPRVQHNETLEFLGDAVLGLLASEILMERFPTAKEGEVQPEFSFPFLTRHLKPRLESSIPLKLWLNNRKSA